MFLQKCQITLTTVLQPMSGCGRNRSTYRDTIQFRLVVCRIVKSRVAGGDWICVLLRVRWPFCSNASNPEAFCRFSDQSFASPNPQLPIQSSDIALYNSLQIKELRYYHRSARTYSSPDRTYSIQLIPPFLPPEVDAGGLQRLGTLKLLGHPMGSPRSNCNLN